MSRDYSVLPRVPWGALGVISAGGMIGALARYGLLTAFPHGATGFPWATFGINAGGCLLIGIIVVLAAGSRRAPRLTRPFLVTGVLGGFTTFSSFSLETVRLLQAGMTHTALLNISISVVTWLLSVWLGYAAAARLNRLKGS